MENYQLPTPAQIAELTTLLEDMKVYIKDLQDRIKAADEESNQDIEMRPDVYEEVANKNRKTKIRQFQPRPVNKQAVMVSQLMEAKTLLTTLQTRIEDTMLVANMQMFERAKLIHQALREASKTDPSLESAVQELDELYRQAMEEQDEDEESEENA